MHLIDLKLNLSGNQDSRLHNRIIIIETINNLPSVSNNRQISHLIIIIKSPCINSHLLLTKTPSIKRHGAFLNIPFRIMNTIIGLPKLTSRSSTHNLANSQTALWFKFTDPIAPIFIELFRIKLLSLILIQLIEIITLILLNIFIVIFKLNFLRHTSNITLIMWLLYFKADYILIWVYVLIIVINFFVILLFRVIFEIAFAFEYLLFLGDESIYID